MPTNPRRAAARRRAWGRGPIILRFEPLEGRALLATSPLPDLVGGAFDTLHNLDWGDAFHAKGLVLNQGTAATTAGFRVAIYASPIPALGPGSVLLGQAAIPAGLNPGQTAPFDQVVSLPPTPISGVGASGSVYIGLVIDPDNAVAESDEPNNAGTGQGYDTSVVTIVPHQPSSLAGASLGVYPDRTQWGGTVNVTAQVHNDAPGDAPPTRARVVLTPAGVAPGGPADVTVGNLDVPAVAAWQTVAVSQTVTLPAVPPSTLVGAGQYTLSVVQDADFLTGPLSPHRATRGMGFDMVPIAISTAQGAGATPGPRPDLTVAALQAPTLPITWGQPFQVTTTIQNPGKLDAGPFRVRFLLVGADGSLNQALFLADASLDGLKAGFGQNVVQTLRLPSKLPGGLTLNAAGVGRIAMVIDPENTLDESNETNNTAFTDTVTLRVVGTDGRTTVPDIPSGNGGTTQTGTPSTPAPRGTGTTPAPAPLPAAARRRRPAPKPKHSLEHNLKVFPKRVSNYLRGLFK